MTLDIVYLDDEVDLLELFSELFSSEKVKVHTFSSPQEAIDYSTAHPPDLIFLDYRLPGTNGDEISKKLDSHLPKVLLTGDINNEFQVDYFSILQKPYSAEDVQKILRQFVSSR